MQNSINYFENNIARERNFMYNAIIRKEKQLYEICSCSNKNVAVPNSKIAVKEYIYIKIENVFLCI